jgi:pyruvate formate lyase activating enzyme
LGAITETSASPRRELCQICPHACVFTLNNPLGRCRVRGFDNPGYGMCTGLAVDPIEKKPLRNFHPGSTVLSTGPNGCNLSCLNCQNWHISQQESQAVEYMSPENLASLATARSDGLAFTYTEPVVWYEYIMDTAPLVQRNNGFVVMVSNGYVNPAPLRDLLRVTDAWNIDLKAWSDDFYRNICGGDLATVKNSIKMVAESNCHLELTWLLIPGHNDDPDLITEAAKWVKATAGENTPMHVSRYFPRYRMNNPQTPVPALNKAVNLFREHLKNVYTGNI